MAKAILTSQAEDFPRWYQDVVAKAELADNGPVRGTMVIRPWAYAIWERLQRELDDRIKAAGVRNAYFPLLIPEDYLRREAEHVEGFSPELAVVTHGGGKQLEHPVVVRPTSETIINSSFAKWVASYRDLPLLVNNWSNVVRWELRPRLFLRTTEFLWQEGHTAHETADEARAFALRILIEIYEDVMRDVMAVPGFTGRNTDREKFAGAVRSWTCEGVMRDGKALQMGTSHELGQGFSKAFGTVFTDRDGQQRHPWQTSWGASTRLLGALIMVHGDDSGLRLPPRLAPVQVVVVVVKDENGAAQRPRELASELAGRGARVELDDRVDVSFGRRVVDWGLKGVPARVELGPRDLAAGRVTLVSRARGSKATIDIAGAPTQVLEVLDVDQEALLVEATTCAMDACARSPMSARLRRRRERALRACRGRGSASTGRRASPSAASASAACLARMARSPSTPMVKGSTRSSRARIDAPPAVRARVMAGVASVSAVGAGPASHGLPLANPRSALGVRSFACSGWSRRRGREGSTLVEPNVRCGGGRGGRGPTYR